MGRFAALSLTLDYSNEISSRTLDYSKEIMSRILDYSNEVMSPTLDYSKEIMSRTLDYSNEVMSPTLDYSNEVMIISSKLKIKIQSDLYYPRLCYPRTSFIRLRPKFSTPKYRG